MKLRLNKSQRTAGLAKKVVFTLGAQVDLSTQEQDYVNRYKMGKEVVYSKERVQIERDDYASAKGIFRNLSAIALNLSISVNDLVNGRTIECKDIIEIIDAEDSIRDACKTLKILLDACSGFEGEEIIEY